MGNNARVQVPVGTSRMAELAQQCLEDSEKWFGDTTTTRDIGFQTLALCGECGELANIVKKIARGSLDAGDANVRHDLAMELTDVFIYMLNIAGVLRIDLERSYEQKRAFNNKRFVEERAKREAKKNVDISKRRG